MFLKMDIRKYFSKKRPREDESQNDDTDVDVLPTHSHLKFIILCLIYCNKHQKKIGGGKQLGGGGHFSWGGGGGAL